LRRQARERRVSVQLAANHEHAGYRNDLRGESERFLKIIGERAVPLQEEKLVGRIPIRRFQLR
jgi:hypothetical protein